MSRPAIVAAILPVTLGGRQPVFAEEEESESRHVCGLSTGADVLSAGFFDSTNAFLNERESRIDGCARTPQTLPRHHRRFSARDARSTAYVVITRVHTMELTSLSHGSSVRMTEYLITARAVMILWTNLAVMPAEIVFDAIEAELERRGIEL
jgi:hypothetical protein